MIVVLAGPGGVGKGTVAARLAQVDRRLHLSRSWTTRPRRIGEPEDAYVWVDRAAFEAYAAAGGFLEHAEFLGNLYGTPMPAAEDLPPGVDLLLEIDAQGAEQVRDRHPDAVVVLLRPPDLDVLAARMRARGDDEDHVQRRLAIAGEEERRVLRIADHVVVNDDLERAVAEVAGILARRRERRPPS